MTHDELLDIIERHQNAQYEPHTKSVTPWDILQTVVELHKPELHQNDNVEGCVQCSSFSYRYVEYPCLTVQAIEKELA